MGVGLCQGIWGCPTHVHACMHVHTSDDVIRDSPGFPYGSSHLHEIIMFIHVCMCARVCCACMCTCAGHPLKHPDRVPSPSTHSHPPNGGTPEISQKSIKIELIKIFEFHLKILDLWTLVHSYRLHLVCRWGGCPITNSIFYFWAQKCTHFLLLWTVR